MDEVPAGRPYILEDVTMYIKREVFPLEFFVYTYQGCEIVTGGDSPETSKPITDKDALKDGDMVWFSGAMGEWRCGKITEDPPGKFYVSDGKLGGCLEFGIDDRKCWTCGSVYSEKALARVDFT